MSEMDEKKFNKLITKISNPYAFNILYKFYYPKIVNHTYFKFRNKDLGEDVAQEFFYKLLTLKIKERIEFPTSWIYKISDNIAIDFLEDEKKYNRAYVNTENENAEDAAFEKLLFGEYKEKLKTLDDDTRRIIIMNDYEGYSLKEIANITETNYNTVRQKYSRGVKKLRNS